MKPKIRRFGPGVKEVLEISPTRVSLLVELPPGIYPIRAPWSDEPHFGGLCYSAGSSVKVREFKLSLPYVWAVVDMMKNSPRSKKFYVSRFGLHFSKTPYNGSMNDIVPAALSNIGSGGEVCLGDFRYGEASRQDLGVFASSLVDITMCSEFNDDLTPYYYDYALWEAQSDENPNFGLENDWPDFHPGDKEHSPIRLYLDNRKKLLREGGVT